MNYRLTPTKTGNPKKKLIAIILLFFLALLVNSIAGQAEAAELSSTEEAYEWLVSEYLDGSVEGLRVYAIAEAVEGPYSIDNWKTTLELGRGTGWLFFIDEMPMANWEHGCRFVFVGGDGSFQEQSSRTPPKQMDLFQEMTTPPAIPNYRSSSSQNLSTLSLDQNATVTNGTDASNRWAVIISGGYNQSNNHVRYWNDCSFFYKTLVANGFLDSHIYVLMADGTDSAVDQSDGITSSPLDLDDDGDDDIMYSATHANITTVFNTLAGSLDEDDILYVFTTDHGGHQDEDPPYSDPDVILYLWGGYITDSDFATEVNKVTTKATICIFEQCFSGGMIDDLKGDNRVLMSASRYWESSYAMGPSYTYDEFSYYVTKALEDTSEGDANDDGVVSMEEAYLYALANDSYQSETVSGGVNYGEHPSYYSNPWDLGRKISLQGYAPVQPPIYGEYKQYQVSEDYPSDGTAMGASGDDVCFSHDLSFAFPFFGTEYSTVHISTNGLLLFDGSDTDPENTVDGLKAKKAIAPLWDDLDTTEMYLTETPLTATVRWVGYTHVDSRPVDFALRIYKNGRIRFFYGSGNEHTSLVQQRDKTIGISNGDGSSYHLCLRNGQNTLDEAQAIEFSPSSLAILPAPIIDILLRTE